LKNYSAAERLFCESTSAAAEHAQHMKLCKCIGIKSNLNLILRVGFEEKPSIL